MLLLATIGVLAATLITGSAAHWFLGLSLLVALVFGAVTAATDPIFAKRIALRALTCRSSCRREESPNLQEQRCNALYYAACACAPFLPESIALPEASLDLFGHRCVLAVEVV